MDFLRCAVSGILFIAGGKCALGGDFDSCLLLFFFAMIVLPYDEVPNFFGPLSVILVIFGFSALSSDDYYRGVLCIAIFLIIAVKLNTKENKSVGGYIGGYSSSGGGGSSLEDDLERQRRERDEEYQRYCNEENERSRRRSEAESLSHLRYGCDAYTASHFDNEINNLMR